MVEEVFIDSELIYQTMGGVQKATEDLEVILTSGELKSLYKGAAPDDVLDLAFGCLHRGNPDLFQSREDVSDLFSSLGKMVKGNLLETPATYIPTVTNACDLPDGSNQNTIAKNFLTSKDPLLSDSEVEELLSREKNRFIEKIKKIHKLLKSFQDGSIFPTFPSLFGSDDSLISETPPVISAALATTSGELYSTTINNFNVAMLGYAPLWKSPIDLTYSESSAEEGEHPTFAMFSRKIMRIDDGEEPIGLIVSLNLDVNDTSTSLGYNMHPEIEDRDGITLDAEHEDDVPTGTYDWTEGDNLNRFDAGKWTTSNILNPIGEDDDRFASMLEDAGIWVPEFSWIKEFIIWFIPDDDANWVDWTIFILEILAALFVAFFTIIFGFATFGSGWILVGSIVSILLAFGLTSIAIHAGVEWLTGLFGETPAREITRDEVECLYAAGDITDAEWKDIEPDLDEIIEMSNRAAIITQRGKINVIANELEKDCNEEGTHTSAFNITDMLLGDPTPDSVTELILITNTSFSGQNQIYTDAYTRVTPLTSETITLERQIGFSEVITTFERRGIRYSGYTTIPDSTQRGLMSIQGLADIGVELVEHDRVETKISNYRMENESSLLLGRKIPESNLLETRYSSTTDVPDKTSLEIFEEQADNLLDGGDVLQDYHLRIKEITRQAELFDFGPVKGQETIWRDCIKVMTRRVHNNRMYLDEYLDALDFEYPKQDIIGYGKVKDDSIDLTISIMKLESSNSAYCDTLTPLRRSGAIAGLRLLIRAFTTERVVNSIQVFDTFNTSFMTSDMFVKAVFDDIKIEMKKYYNSFADTLNGEIFSDMKSTASKYLEIQRLLGSEMLETSTDKEAILEVIRMEVEDMNTTISSQLKLDTKYHSSSWDDFVFDILLQDGEQSSGSRSFINTDGDEDYGPVLESYKSVLYPFQVITRNEQIEDTENYTYYAELIYEDTDKNGKLYTIVSAQCEGVAPPTSSGVPCEPDTTDYSIVRQLLFNNEIYQDMISYVFPLKDAATLISTYHLSAITDPAVFSATINGRHVTDLFSETKLSTLQTFLACVHGAVETTYIDPFLEKLKT